MNRIKDIATDSKIQLALSGLAERETELLDLIISVQQIPAPTFDEADRAAFVEKYFSNLGLQDVRQDRIHNVYARFRGTNSELSTPLIVSAHSDTVFPIETDLSITRNGHLLCGPGIGDNATGVAGIMTLAKTLRTLDLVPKSDIWFIVNVGEEGLGNLSGMRAVVKKFGRQARYIVVEGGSYGQIIHEAIGVCRFRIGITTKGGHSWGSFGQPSAIHEIGHLIADISRLSVPISPKTTYNIGVIEGGTTVNSIASSASFLLDLRSEETAVLEELVSQVKAIVESRRAKAKQEDRDVAFHMEQVGSRPAGQIHHEDPLVFLAEKALHQVGWPHVMNIAGSTDANIPLSQNIPCVCVGLTTSGNSHRLDEYIDLTHLQAGMQQLILLALAAADY